MKNWLQEAGKLQLAQKDLVNGVCATSFSAWQINNTRCLHPKHQQRTFS